MALATAAGRSATTSSTDVHSALSAEGDNPSRPPWPRPQLHGPAPPSHNGLFREAVLPQPSTRTHPRRRRPPSRPSRGLLRGGDTCSRSPSPAAATSATTSPTARPRNLVHGDDVRARRSRELVCGGVSPLPSPSPRLWLRPQRHARGPRPRPQRQTTAVPLMRRAPPPTPSSARWGVPALASARSSAAEAPCGCSAGELPGDVHSSSPARQSPRPRIAPKLTKRPPKKKATPPEVAKG